MNQMTCYLYEYRRDQKIKNVGFLKTQRQGKKIKIHINGRGMAVKNEESFHFYMFYVQEKNCMTALLGQVKGKSGSINCIIDIDESQLPGGTSLDQMDGVMIELDNGNKYVATWKAVAINVDNMIIIKDTMENPIPPDMEQEFMSNQEECGSEEEKIVRHQEMQGSVCGGMKCHKIQRQDIGKLPRKEWKLANNSFLLHGYYNYHHLLFIEESTEANELLWLGVPGVFHQKEKSVARHFGFQEFRRIDKEVLQLDAGEKNEQEDFGYWCRQVSTGE